MAMQGGNKQQYNERELVKGCIDNDRRCQETLYKMFFPTMLRMCLRHTKDREVALEIINSGFLRVFQNLAKFGFKGSLEGWIRKLVFHALADYFQKHNRRMKTLLLEDRDAGIEEEANANLGFQEILRLVDELPPATREVFVLYAIEGFTHPEISRRINISEGTSKWHLANARTKLKTLLKEQDEVRYATR